MANGNIRMFRSITTRPAKWLFRQAACAAAIAALFTDGHGVVGVVGVAPNHSPNDRDGTSMIIINNDDRQLQTANWDLNFLGFNADLSPDSTDELVTNFEIGKDRVVETQLLTHNCDSAITGINITETRVRTNQNETHELLTVGYSIDKSMISGSNIWNDVSSTLDQLEFCQVIQLINPASESNPKLVIAEIKSRFVVDVDLTVDFAFDQSLTPPTPNLVMIIEGNITISDVDLNATSEEIESIKSVFALAIEEEANEGLGEGERSVTNVTVFSLQFEPFSYIDFEIVLEEVCFNTTACQDLINTTTMYEDVTSHISNEIANAGFNATLQSIAIDYARRYLQEYGSSSPHSYLRKLKIDFPVATGVEADPPITSVIEPNIGHAAGGADLISHVEACKCDGAQSFTCNTDALVPNSGLYVCIRSVSPGVEIDSIDSMIITQPGSTNLDVIDDSTILYSSITSWEFVSGCNGIAVSTRVPINSFSYAEGEFLTISGLVVVRFAGDGRKLQVVTSDAVFNENALFQLKVGVSDNSAPPVKVLNNSADTDTSKVFAVLGLIFSFVFTIFWEMILVPSGSIF